MRAIDLKKTIDTFNGNADGGAYHIRVYLRSGNTITGAVHAFKDESAVWIDAITGDGDISQTCISVENIDAVQWLKDGIK